MLNVRNLAAFVLAIGLAHTATAEEIKTYTIE